MSDLLSDEDIGKRLGDLDGWSREGEAVVKKFDRDDFVGSVDFVKAIVEPAEAMGHHPDLEIAWSEVTVTITNHSAGGLTEADFVLAEKIDDLA